MASNSEATPDEICDFRKVQQYLEACSKGKLLLIDPYLKVLGELTKLFLGLGKMFGWVSDHAKRTINCIEIARVAPDGNIFEDLQALLHYESQRNLTAVPKSLEIFRNTNRWLKFTSIFLIKVKNLSIFDNVAAAGHSAYEKTFAKEHSVITRNLAKLAMEALPKKDEFLRIVLGADCTPERDFGGPECQEERFFHRAVGRIIRKMEAVHAKTAKICAAFQRK